MRKKSIVFSLLVMVVMATLTFWSCGNKEKKSDLSLQEADKLVKISVRMKWFFAGTMTGWFAAKEHGYFERHGLDVTITPGGPQNSSVKLVAAKTDDFGVTGADELLLARSQGIPVVAIAVLFKHSPVCFVSKAEKGIKSPKDWAGKKIEVSYGENAEYQYRALRQKFNIKDADVKEVPYTFSVIPFIEDKVDVSPAYAMDQAATLEMRGIKLDKIFAKDYGIDPYGDIIITREEILKDRPELVKEFVAAVLESHNWAKDHIEESVDALIKNVDALKKEEQLVVFQKTIPFIYPEDDSLPIGKMSIERWEESQTLLLTFKVLEKKVDLSKAFINDFLPY
jgi:ABC-type nitrate/sulfonate/bicarbonate transport system substrate-binding protein